MENDWKMNDDKEEEQAGKGRLAQCDQTAIDKKP